MKKTSSQSIITDKKKTSMHQSAQPYIEGLNSDSQKIGWEHQVESPLDEKKLYRHNLIEDTENSPSQYMDSPIGHNKSSQINKAILSNNYIEKENLNREESKKEVIKLKHIATHSDRKISGEEDKEKFFLPRPPEMDKFGQFSQQDGQKTSPNKSTMKNDKLKIIPGYTKNCIDDNNPDHNSVKGLFSEGEIKEAFDTLDMNKNQYITAEDLGFFLDVLEEEVQEEEIEEMIRLCDIEGNGRVKYEEFQRMASGQSLAPIGQAYPPTFQMIERKKQLETMELKQNNSLAKMEFLKNLENENNNAVKKNEYDSMDNMVMTRMKNQKGTENEAKNTNKGQIKESSEVKRNNIKRFVQYHSIYGEKLIKNFDNLKQIDETIILECDYISFLKYFGLTEDNEINKNAFYALVDNEEKNINLKNFFICLIGLQDIGIKEKLGFCFNLVESENSGFISLKELVRLIQHFQINFENNKIEIKIKLVLKEKKVSENMISKEKLIELFYEYPSIFLP